MDVTKVDKSRFGEQRGPPSAATASTSTSSSPLHLPLPGLSAAVPAVNLDLIDLLLVNVPAPAHTLLLSR
eukprot:765715-Hanusia_phi.AAC.6